MILRVFHPSCFPRTGQVCVRKGQKKKRGKNLCEDIVVDGEIRLVPLTPSPFPPSSPSFPSLLLSALFVTPFFPSPSAFPSSSPSFLFSFLLLPLLPLPSPLPPSYPSFPVLLPSALFVTPSFPSSCPFPTSSPSFYPLSYPLLLLFPSTLQIFVEPPGKMFNSFLKYKFKVKGESYALRYLSITPL